MKTPLHHVLAIYQSPITCLGEDLSRLIEQAPFSAHVRDARTSRYLQCNQAAKDAMMGSESVRDFVGLKPRDLFLHRTRLDAELGYNESLKQKHVELLDKAYELSNRILSERVPTVQRDIELSLSGVVRVTQTIRSPVFDSKRRVVAIASLECDFADRCELSYLYQLYRRYLPVKVAIQNFLHYLGLASHFLQMPTHRELLTLLYMRKNSTSKWVGHQLKVSPRTIDEYRAKLNSKLKNIDLIRLLIIMRTRNEHNFFWD